MPPKPLPPRKQRRTTPPSSPPFDLHLLWHALPTPLAVIAPSGAIIFTNHAWETFSTAHFLQRPDLRVGCNYLNHCQNATGEGSSEARQTALGLRRVLRGETPAFEIEYALSSTNEPRWFRLTATPMPDQPGTAVVMHIDVTEHRRTEILMEAFSNLGQKLSAASTPQEAARIILQTSDHIWGWDCAYLSLYSEKTNLIHPVLTFDIVDGKKCEVANATRTASPPSPRLTQVIKTGAQLILRHPDQMQSEGLLPFGDKTRLSASIMVAPVRLGTKVTGILSIDSYTFNAYTHDALIALQALADHCAGALERIWAQEALRESETRLRALAARLQSAREAESLRIAREIHDELGQAMTGLKLDLLWLEKTLKKDLGGLSSSHQERIQSLVPIADRTIQTVRRIATELRPGILDDLGLIPALEWQTREFQTRTGVKCEASFPDDPLTLDQPRATAVFRIFQEILTNIARHAQASRVHINLCQNGPDITLEVRDNGVGINEKEIADAKSLGLLGLRERALLFGGQVLIQRTRPKGTRVCVKIPLFAAPPGELNKP